MKTADEKYNNHYLVIIICVGLFRSDMAKNLNGQNVDVVVQLYPWYNLVFSFVSLLIKNKITMNIKQKKTSDYSNHNLIYID